MKLPPVRQIRRLALAAAAAVVLVLTATYAVRRWRAEQARQQVTAPMPGDVQQQSERFTFSRSELGRTIFTVQALRTIERAGKTVVLEDVAVTIHGRQGDRADEIRTARCEYDLGETGIITCPGEVAVRLGSGLRPSGGAADRSIQLSTSAVQFDTNRGTAWTEQRVEFSFPQGSGEALGLRYQATEPRVRLERQVAIQVRRSAGAPVDIRGAQLHYFAVANAFELVPPLELRVEHRRLTAERLRVELDDDFRTRRIEAHGRVLAQVQDGERPLLIRAAQAVADYSAAGYIEQLRAQGQVEFEAQGKTSKERLTCEEALFAFDARHRDIERITASGAARLVSETSAEVRELRAPVIELVAGPTERILAPRPRGTLVLRRGASEQRTIVADRLELQFGEQQRLRALDATGTVETESRTESRGETTASENLRARFDTQGRLEAAEQWGRFRYRGGGWQAQAGRADYHAATATFVLREQPAFWDATNRTTARTVELEEKTGVLRAEGDVRTTYQPSSGATGGFGSSEPAHLAAEHLRVERARGWARYEGQARLWQGQNRLAAQAIELERAPRQLVAEGNVTGLFLEAAAEGAPERETPATPQAIRIRSERFTYFEGERHGIFEGRVAAQNGFGTLTAPRLEVFLAEQAGGGARLERALATGGVLIEQAGGQARSEQAEYRADEQTVALWGGTPTIFDRQRGTTTGHRLTLFLADGSIAVDSAEGTRTITRRPWAQ
ncbi:MAG: hypothetical protein HYY26_03750 [Acidobacteria bacterium]|nr:hypothetical protein [Acidobacteriota bacterium]